MPAFYLPDKYITMNKTNLDQALAALSDALKSTDPDSFLENPKDFVKKIPFRSLTGDHINGGKIINFSSSGIVDTANNAQISISDNGVSISKFSQGFSVAGNIKSDSINTSNIITDRIEAKEIIGKFTLEEGDPIELTTPLKFKSDNLDGSGLLWVGKGNTKQLVFLTNPDRIFLSENIDLSRNKNYSINNIMVLNENSLGTTVTKSYLREVGRLKGLIVEGTTSLGEHFYFDSSTGRFGLGTDQPNAAVSISEKDVEIIIGSSQHGTGAIGTFNSQDFQIVTDNTARITINSGGNIVLGNPTSPPIHVNVLGTLSVNVNTPDPRASLQVSGSIKFNNRLQSHGISFPDSGSFNKGDIVWNIEPRIGSYVGWICTQSGSPGLWEPFGKIGNQ
jgi:hypothetical protein